jgi:hypothetical protein
MFKTCSLLFALFLMVIVTGCKVTVLSGPGGRVESASGAHDCAGNQSCTINIVDYFFEEEFTGVADEGYRFAGWRKRNRGLCGGGRKACKLTTLPFAEQRALDAFLESDQEFFLEAVFEADSATSGSGVGSAASCFHPELWERGDKIALNYRSTDPEAGKAYRHSQQQTARGEKQFKGYTAIESDWRISAVDSPGDTEGTLYSGFDRARKLFFAYGSDMTTTIPEGTARTIVVRRPPEEMDFSLKPGEVHRQTFEAEIETTFGGDFNTTSTTRNEIVTEFLGEETVNVPAGTFRACKFVQVSTTDDGGLFGPEPFTTVLWLSTQHGVMLKAESADSLTELRSGKVNGKEI